MKIQKALSFITLSLLIGLFTASCGSESETVNSPYTGKLLLLVNPSGPVKLEYFELDTFKETVVYEFPEGSYVSTAETSPDQEQIVIGYYPVFGEFDIPANVQALFILPADGSGEPTPLLVPEETNESLIYPTWSPDGDYVYFSRYIQDFEDGEFLSILTVERVSYPGGEVEVIIENAYLPKVSPDGNSLIFVSIASDEDLGLFISDIDGGNQRPIIQVEGFNIIDAPAFSPDSKSVIFSIPEEATQTSSRTWLDWLMGVTVAKAHSVPSDWWVVDIENGVPEKLTNLTTIALNGDFSEDGDQIASIYIDGLFIMNKDGSELEYLELGNGDIPFGTLDWVP